MSVFFPRDNFSQSEWRVIYKFLMTELDRLNEINYQDEGSRGVYRSKEGFFHGLLAIAQESSNYSDEELADLDRTFSYYYPQVVMRKMIESEGSSLLIMREEARRSREIKKANKSKEGKSNANW